MTSDRRDDVFVFTECFNCGKVLNPCLESFHKHHDQRIHIFGKRSDFSHLTPHPNNVFIEMGDDEDLARYYKEGHKGTAYIFAKVYSGQFRLDKVIHIDSDVYFRRESLSLLISALDAGYDIVGPYRNYKHNPYHREDLYQYPDTVAISFFGMNIKKIKAQDYPPNLFMEMCGGSYNPLGHPVIDFFDPVIFVALRNGAAIHYLDFNEVGGYNEWGSRNNKYQELNDGGFLDVGDRLIHFGGVGSGYSFYTQGLAYLGRFTQGPESEHASAQLFFDTAKYGKDHVHKDIKALWHYIHLATSHYAYYAKLFFDEDINIAYDQDHLQKIRDLLDRD